MTENTTEPTSLDSFAVVEIMGRQVIAGKVSEQTIAGAQMLRVDVPEDGDTPAFTKFLSAGALYAISPCTEEEAREVQRYRGQRKINVYIPSTNRLLPEPEYDEGYPHDCCGGCRYAKGDYCESVFAPDEDGCCQNHRLEAEENEGLYEPR